MSMVRGDVQIVRDEPIEDYHAHYAASKSNLKVYNDKGPLAYHLGTSTKQTPAMVAGALLDSKLTGEGQFVVRPPGMDGRTREGKAWKAQQERLGIRVIGQSDLPRGIDSPSALMEWADDAVEAIRQHETIGPLLLRSESQVTLRTAIEDPFDGLTIQSRPDFIDIDLDHTVTVDLKKSAMFNDFERQAYNLWYDVQMAMTDVQLEAMGVKKRTFYWLVVSDNYPAQIKLSKLDEAWIKLGRSRFMTAASGVHSCMRLGDWPRSLVDEEVSCPPTWAKG